LPWRSSPAIWFPPYPPKNSNKDITKKSIIKNRRGQYLEEVLLNLVKGDGALRVLLGTENFLNRRIHFRRRRGRRSELERRRRSGDREQM